VEVRAACGVELSCCVFVMMSDDGFNSAEDGLQNEICKYLKCDL
jgi:hypothetical protein